MRGFSKMSIQVGVWQIEQRVAFVWLDKEQNPQGFCTTMDMLTQAKRRILTYFGSVQKIRLSFITAISPHQIWTKSIFLSQQLSEQDCEQQCRFLLEQELSIPLPMLWFDYCVTKVQQGIQITLLAIQKSIAQQYLMPLSVLNIEILDNLVYAILRAFRFLMPQADSLSTLFLYQDEKGCIALQEQQHQVLALQQTHSNLTALYMQFCQRYQCQPVQVIVYRTMGASVLPLDWIELHTDVSMIALGNALWGVE